MNKKRILVVDDEVSITRLLKLNLERTGRFEIREENSGEAACAAAESFQPDLILTDVMMPDMGGGEVAARLREDPVLRKIPVIFLTAAVKKEELGGSQGMIGGRLYIAKPLDFKGMLAAIDQVLGS
jgi:CheY-like chemotaxis protein